MARYAFVGRQKAAIYDAGWITGTGGGFDMAMGASDGRYVYQYGKSAGLPLFRRYEPASDTWTTLSHQGNAKWGDHGAAVVGDNLYLFSGHKGNGKTFETWIYDIVGNSWSIGSPTPSHGGAYRSWPAAVPVGTDIYLVGGETDIGYDFVDVYDSVSDSWSSAASMPAYEHQIPGAVLVNGYIHTIGANFDLFEGDIFRLHSRYSVSGDSWETIGNIPSPVIGGYLWQPDPVSLIYDAGTIWAVTAWNAAGSQPSRGGKGHEIVGRYDVTAQTWETELGGPGINTDPYAVFIGRADRAGWGIVQRT